MSAKVKELNEKRTTLFGQISKLREEFNGGGQKWKDGEQAKTWDAVNKNYDACMDELTQAQAAASVDSRFAAIEERNKQVINPHNIGLDNAGNGRVGTREAPGGDKPLTREQIEEARCLAVDGWLRSQMGTEPTKKQARAARQVKLNLNAKSLRLKLPHAGQLNSLRTAWHDHQSRNRGSRPFEYNASLTTTLGSTGGNIIAPETLLTTLEVNMLAFGAVRQYAEQITTSHGEPMSWPTFDDTSNEGRELAENQPADDNAGAGTSGDGGPNPSFGKTTWNAYKFTSDALLVPYELLEDAAIPLVPIIGNALGERLGRITNRRFTVGSGATTAQGIVTGATLGVTAASASVITPDEVIDLEHSVDVAYRDGAMYMLPDSVLLHLRKKKDDNNNYIWQSGFNGGSPDTLNNRPYTVNNHMASIAASAFVMVFGNFSRYKIRRVNQIRLYRLEERYREKDKDGFVAFVREDGGILNAGTAPIKSLQMHS